MTHLKYKFIFPEVKYPFKDFICPLFISKQTQQCIKGSITL